MKNQTISKKILAVAAAAAMGLSLTACGSVTSVIQPSTSEETSSADSSAAGSVSDPAGAADSSSSGSSGESASYKIAVVKQMDHASLDEITEAITAELDTIAEENNITIQCDVYSGQGDQSVLMQIGDQVVADGVDAIIPVATLAAQVMAVCAEETQTPVIYAAISDPESAEVTGIDYVTGTSDALDTNAIMEMIQAQNPNLEKVGLLYSLSEPNSTTPIAEAKAYLEEQGIEYTEATGNTNDEVIAAASVLISEGVDAVFTPTDNIVMAAELAISGTFIEAGIPHYTGADSFVRNGAFATCGVNYTDLGTETADLAYQAITEGMEGMEDYYKVAGGVITVNTETADALGIDTSIFAEMGDLVEVTTTED